MQSFTIFMKPNHTTIPIEIRELKENDIKPISDINDSIVNENTITSTPIQNVRNKKDIKRHSIIGNFDPNQVDSLEMIALGFPKYLIKNLSKYRNKGGLFYECHQLLKMEGMDHTLFN